MANGLPLASTCCWVFSNVYIFHTANVYSMLAPLLISSIYKSLDDQESFQAMYYLVCLSVLFLQYKYSAFKS